MTQEEPWNDRQTLRGPGLVRATLWEGRGGGMPQTKPWQQEEAELCLYIIQCLWGAPGAENCGDGDRQPAQDGEAPGTSHWGAATPTLGPRAGNSSDVWPLPCPFTLTPGTYFS